MQEIEMLWVDPLEHSWKFVVMYKAVFPEKLWPTNLPVSSMSSEDAKLCIDIDENGSEIFIAPDIPELSMRLRSRIEDVLAYFIAVEADGFDKCLIPASLQSVLTCDLDELLQKTSLLNEMNHQD